MDRARLRRAAGGDRRSLSRRAALKLLLDTHALLWWLDDDPTLRKAARTAIEAEDAEVAVSAATVWEIAIKHALGKLRLPEDIEGAIAYYQFRPLPISVQHAIGAGALPLHHADPFDRILVAQARAEHLTIVTRDPRILLYGVPTIAA